MSKKGRGFLISRVALGVVLGATVIAPTIASASPIIQHAYAQTLFPGTNTGGYFSSTNGQEDLFSNWSSTNNGSFITKEMWVYFNGNEWIEVGDVDGSINLNYWNGHYEAYQRKNSDGTYTYNEFTLGSKGTTGTHNYEIQYVGSNAWNVYIDYTKMDFWTFTYPTAAGMHVGIESDDSGNTFTKGTYASALEYLNTGGTWTYWTSGSNGDSNSLGWSSSFSYSNGNNKIVYNHN